MTQNFNNEVMDERVARLNEFKSVKMSSISRGKRPAAKFNKEVATYLLNNWSNIDQLKLCVDAMRKDMPEACKEVMDIYDKRVKELVADKTETSVKKSANKRKTGASKTRKVGDRHPNGLWIWTEYKKGKFDWRIDPAIKRKPGRKGGVTTNQSKKKEVAGKAEKAKPAAAPKLTLEELLTKPTPQGLSKSQKAVIKFIKRGYRLREDGDNLWLTDSHGNNERVEKSVLEALQRKYKIDYIPEGLRYNK